MEKKASINASDAAMKLSATADDLFGDVDMEHKYDDSESSALPAHMDAELIGDDDDIEPAILDDDSKEGQLSGHAHRFSCELQSGAGAGAPQCCFM